jgi:hypothetical protein
MRITLSGSSSRAGSESIEKAREGILDITPIQNTVISSIEVDCPDETLENMARE